MSDGQAFLRSVAHAVHGFIAALRYERNFRIDCVIAVLVLLAAYVFALNAIEWCVLLLCIALVLATELLNTALERLTDLASPTQHPLAALSKDTAAAAALVAASISVVIGLVLFLPKVLDLLAGA